jgi:hypothetical protein
MLLSISSCGPCDKEPPIIEKVDTRPFTYRIIGADGCLSLRPHILRAWVFDYVPDPNIPSYVMVHQWHQLNIDVRWEIIARKPISADGFELTIGKVPEGFEQVVPPPNESFIPVLGKDYNLEVETDWPCYQTYGVDSSFLEFAEKEREKGF